MHRPHTIAAGHLDLVLLTPPVMEALLAGDPVTAGRLLAAVPPPSWPDEPERRWLGRRLAQTRGDPDVAIWLGRAMVVRESGEVVGHIGFHDRPDATGTVEVGYTVFAAHRRRGHAWEAVNALWNWARSRGVRRLRASVSPSNEASLALVRKLDMRPVGTQWDEEDGEELVFLKEEGVAEPNPYSSFLGGRDAVTVIAGTVARVEALLDALPGAAADRSPRPGKWSAREILCHLADTEVVFAFRLRQVLAEEHHVIQPFDQEIWARRYAGCTTAQALDLLRATRAWNLELIRAVTPPEWAKKLTHPERGTMTYRVLVDTMAGHDLNHLGQIEAITRVAVQA